VQEVNFICLDLFDEEVARMQAEEQPSEVISPAEIPGEQFTGGRKRSTRRRRFVIFGVVALVNVGLLLLLGSQLLTPTQQSKSNAASSPLIGHPAPDFTLAELSTHPAPAPTIHLASLKGMPVILNFWASWCDPCQHEAPLLQATWQQVQHQGIVLLGIDFQDTQSDGLKFLHTYGITYLNVVDSTGATAINYGVSGVPETFFLNRQGVIVSKVIGELTEQTIQSNLRLLAG
jgi:cytochrome c biogenesis protein CcmG/thiol:disulfide interchange protein DsbE